MIIVTGMQRSGTSLVCQLLSAAGVSFGRPSALLAADRWNPGGYFESIDAVDLNSRIMHGCARHQSRLGGALSKIAYLRMPPKGSFDARATRLRASIGALGAEHRGGAVKDPRFCLTLRYWRQWTNVRHVVVCMRDPGAVVSSLAQRYALPRWLGSRFFAYHVDGLVDQLPGRDVTFVDVDRVVSGDTAELERVLRAVGLCAGAPSSRLLGDVVRSDLWSSSRDGGACSQRALAANRRLRERAAASAYGEEAARA